ncbi:MAG: AMP-binding protein [bacterium]
MLLHHRFIRIARTFGDKLAFIDRTTSRRLTYSRALIAALILANKFKKVPKGFIGIMLPTSAGAGLSVLAALMSGRTPVLLNYSTGAQKNAEFAQRKCNFDTIITSRALLEKVQCAEIEGMVFIEDIMSNVSGADKLRAALKSKLPLALLLEMTGGQDEHATSVILFTSGSEKEPKAVQLTHRNIIANIEGFSGALALGPQERMLAILPYFHVFGLTTNLWTPLYHGMTLVTYANPLEFKAISRIVREEKATMMVGTPSFFWGYLLKSEPGDYASVNLAVCGADKCPEKLRQAFMQKHDVVLLEGYGATETAPVIATNTPQSNKPGSVGKPIAGVHVRIQNYETGIDCPPGQTGKILVKSNSVMKGYFDDLEETSLRIRSGWYDTGDMGYLDEDGFLWHAGRLKRFVKIGGEMVSLVAVEETLTGLLPQEYECCVVEIPDAVKGAKVVAAVTGEVDRRKILHSMSHELPNIALPKQFVVLEELPKMGSGKVDFRTTTEMVRRMLHDEVEAVA